MTDRPPLPQEQEIKAAGNPSVPGQSSASYTSLAEGLNAQLQNALNAQKLGQARSDLVQDFAPEAQKNIASARDLSQRVAGEAPSAVLRSAQDIGTGFLTAARESAQEASNKNVLDIFAQLLTVQDKADEQKLAEEQLRMKKEEAAREAAKFAAETGIEVEIDPVTGETTTKETGTAIDREGMESVQLIDDLLASDTDPITGNLRLALGTKAQAAEGKLKQLVSKLQLKDIDKLKGQGTITDAERAILKDSLTALNIDKNGRSSLSDEDFRTELNKIKSALTGGAEQQVIEGGVIMTGPMGDYTVPADQVQVMEDNGYRRK